MFFPTPTGIINRTISSIESEKKGERTKYSKLEASLSSEDVLRKTYGDGNRRYTFKSVSEFSKSKPFNIVKGKKLEGGFRQLLSNNGKTTHLVRFKEGVRQEEPVDFDYLEGKTLVICCFHVPVRCLDSEEMRAVIDAFKEGCFRSQFESVELVVVAYMKTDLNYDLKSAFYHFYSAFSCLAIPFSDFETCDYIYSCMSNHTKYKNQNFAVMVSPEGLVIYDRGILDHFYYYGSNAPETPLSIIGHDPGDNFLSSTLDPMVLSSARGEQNLSLYRDILLCDPLLILQRYDVVPETEDDVSMTVIELSRKYVGLYLCINGEIMEEIKAAHDHCLANNQQLEIVIVPLPFYDGPELYYDDLYQALTRLNIKSWFIFEYNSNVCRRLWRTFGRGFLWLGEKFIIIPPNCKDGELCGREVITNFGVHEYPFTRTAILKRRLEYLTSLTPVFSSVFNNCWVIHKGKQFESQDLLNGKNVLLYIGLSDTGGRLNDLLHRHYNKIKAMGWEVVFVLLQYEQRIWNGEIVEPDFSDCRLHQEEMPWPCMRLSTKAQASIKKKLIFRDDFETSYLFAVAKNGKIVSRDVENRLDTLGVSESLFDDVLEHDLSEGLAKMPVFDQEH